MIDRFFTKLKFMLKLSENSKRHRRRKGINVRVSIDDMIYVRGDAWNEIEKGIFI